MVFDIQLARAVGKQHSKECGSENGLAESFAQICAFLSDNPSSLSWRGKDTPLLTSKIELEILAKRYFSGFRASNFPSEANTVPDEMVSVVLQYAHGYSEERCSRIKIEHQQSMIAENCVGALLERYLDSVLRKNDWHWCCGSFVRAIDFAKKDNNGNWLVLQIKNRDNSENSSSSAIRKGTTIEKWFRTFSKSGKTNWENLPPLMQGYGLSEEGFIEFVGKYLRDNKPKSQ